MDRETFDTLITMLSDTVRQLGDGHVSVISPGTGYESISLHDGFDLLVSLGATVTRHKGADYHCDRADLRAVGIAVYALRNVEESEQDGGAR